MKIKLKTGKKLGFFRGYSGLPNQDWRALNQGKTVVLHNADGEELSEIPDLIKNEVQKVEESK